MNDTVLEFWKCQRQHLPVYQSTNLWYMDLNFSQADPRTPRSHWPRRAFSQQAMASGTKGGGHWKKNFEISGLRTALLGTTWVPQASLQASARNCRPNGHRSPWKLCFFSKIWCAVWHIVKSLAWYAGFDDGSFFNIFKLKPWDQWTQKDQWTLNSPSSFLQVVHLPLLGTWWKKQQKCMEKFTFTQFWFQLILYQDSNQFHNDYIHVLSFGKSPKSCPCGARP